MNKSAKDVTETKGDFDRLSFWSFTYYLLKGLSAKVFSHGVFVIIIILLTVFVCLLSKQSDTVTNIKITAKETKSNETNSQAN